MILPGLPTSAILHPQTAKKPAIQLPGVVLLMAIIFLLSGCTGRTGKQAEPSVSVPADSLGWNYLFDGETLDGWEITNFGPQGPVYVSGGSIILEMGDGTTGITIKDKFPTMNYEVELEARKITGNDFFCGMTFPVEDSYCSLIVGGWSGPVVGLSSIDDLDASENETQILKKFEHDTWYKIRLKVTPDKIEAWIDDEQVVNFETAGRKLSIRPEVGLSRPFGIASWRTTAALRDIKVRDLSTAGTRDENL
jgi:hypothetical protein